MKKANLIFSFIILAAAFYSCNFEDSVGITGENVLYDTLFMNSKPIDTIFAQRLTTKNITSDFYDKVFDTTSGTRPILEQWTTDTINTFEPEAVLDTSVSPPLIWLNFDKKNYINEFYTSRTEWNETISIQLDSMQVFGSYQLIGGIGSDRWSALTIRIKEPQKDYLIYAGKESPIEIEFREYVKGPDNISVKLNVIADVPYQFYQNKTLLLEGNIDIVFELE